ncbi:MAG: hypothetical protein N3E44_05055 [Candidatus Bathyarchaeota archaeon]|nr:hypothetical protein [Candidatus Bathyarchaeota archaeon]
MVSIDEDVLAKLVKDKTLEKVLYYIAEGKPLSIHYDLEHGYHYPQIESEAEILPSESARILSDLASLKILSEKILFLSVICPKCHSTNIAVVYRCPRCGSVAIRKDLLMEHIPCGYIGFKPSFEEKGLAVCPRCGKTVSEDVRIVGVWFVCSSCGSRFPEPGHNLFCRICKEFFTVKDSSMEFIVEYYVSDEVSATLRKLIFPSRIKSILEDSGFRVEENIAVKGKSGVVHPFDFIVRRDPGRAIAFLIENTLKPITEAKVIEWYTRSVDVGMDVVYVTAAYISDGARNLMKFYDLSVVEAEDSRDAEAKVRKIVEALRG